MPRKSELLEELTEKIGYGETIELVRAWGGRRLWVPRGMASDHPIALTIGLVAGQLLEQSYGGTELELPAERNALTTVRNNAIMRDLGKGDSVRECALRYGLSPRHIRCIRDKHAAPEIAGGYITPSH